MIQKSVIELNSLSNKNINRKDKSRTAKAIKKKMEIYKICRNYLDSNPNETTIIKQMMDILNKINIHTKRLEGYALDNGLVHLDMKHLEYQKKVMEFLLSDIIIEL